MVTFDATDFDNAATESGVVHESVANTDHNNASVLKQGYQIANPYLSADLVGYWPLQEDSGTTAYDFSGNANDGTTNGGVTVNQTGLLGTSAYSFDGTDDYVDMGDTYSSPENGYTISFWLTNGGGSDFDKPSMVSAGSGSGYTVLFRYNYNLGEIELYHEGGYLHNIAQNVDGSFQHIVATYDGATSTLYYNGSEISSASLTAPSSTSTGWWVGRRIDSADGFWDGIIGEVRICDSALTASEIQTLYDVVANPGTLTTPTKTV